ncbi:glycosyltransferase family 4 protein [Acidithiobacillus sp.]
MKVAIVHDWLVTYAGAERVLREMLTLYPQADLFAVVDFLGDADRERLLGKHAQTTFIQGLPWARKKYRGYLPLMPLAIEQLDLSAYDLVLSSSHAVAKGVLTGPDQLHLCMCYSPIRYAWDLQHQYLSESGLDHGAKGWLAKIILHYLRLWDSRTASGVDSFIAISHYIGRRILKTYRRSSSVIYPPVDVAEFPLRRDKEDFYVTASRMVPYKKVDLIVEAFNAMPDKRLVVIGDGPGFAKVKAAANVELVGFADQDVLRDTLQRARAFVFAAEEDFGIAPVEAQACGTPVIAFGKGGALETVRGLGLVDEKPTGLFFAEQSVPAIVEAVGRFEREGTAITAENCRENALRFAPERFRREFGDFVEREWTAFRSGACAGTDAHL